MNCWLIKLVFKIQGTNILKQIKNFMKFKSYLLSIAVCSFIAFTACDKDFEYSNESATKAYVAIHHAVPATTASGTTNVDLYLNDKLVSDTFRAFAYNTSFSGGGGIPYFGTAPGTITARVNAFKSTTVLLPNTALTLEASKYYSVFAFDTITLPNNAIKALVLNDDLSAPANAANAKIRFLHLSPNAPAVDVWAFKTTMDSVKLYNNITYIGNSAPNAAALSAFIEVPAIPYNAIRVRLAGTNTNAVTITSPVLAPGKIYSILARGIVGLPTTSANTLGSRIILHN
jgi:hypothetical protein